MIPPLVFFEIGHNLIAPKKTVRICPRNLSAGKL
jgi:hypothetical protein